MAEEAPPPIEEIEDRLEDLTEALREAGDDETAEMLERHADGFTDRAAVRREVNAIRQHLVRWRDHPEELVESAKVQLAANRLEDVCIEALGSGVIEAAPLSLGEHSRRKLGIIFGTLLIGSVIMLIPILLVEAGIDFDDLGEVRELPPVELPRGEEAVLEVSALRPAKLPGVTEGVEVEIAGGCQGPLGNGTCTEAPPRLWPNGRLPTYELKLRNQAYGLLFSLGEGRMLGDVGQGSILLAATNDTPEGRYELPLALAYLGYTPQSCELQDRLLGSCPKPRTGEGEKHSGVAAPLMVIQVVRGDPNKREGERRVAEAEAEEARAKARARAEELAAAMAEIEKLTAETEKHIRRRRWTKAKVNIEKLSALFAPLDGVALTEVAEDLPLEIGSIRLRIEKLEEKLQDFEDKIFERTFSTLTANANKKISDERLFSRVAGQFRVGTEYVQGIYTSRATEIQERMEALAAERRQAEEAAKAEREKRCGRLPTDSWQVIGQYLERLNPGVEVELGECMTPRLTDDTCWEMVCHYERRVEISVERPKIVTEHKAKFFVTRGRVVGHRGG